MGWIIPPGAIYYFAPDCEEDTSSEPSADARGIFRADGIQGYAKLYAHG